MWVPEISKRNRAMTAHAEEKTGGCQSELTVETGREGRGIA